MLSPPLRWGLLAPERHVTHSQDHLARDWQNQDLDISLSFRLHIFSTSHDLLSADLAWVWASWRDKARIFIQSACGPKLSLADFETDQCALPQLAIFHKHILDGWVKTCNHCWKNNSCCRVSHQAVCAWRTAYYVERTNQGINSKELRHGWN